MRACRSAILLQHIGDNSITCKVCVMQGCCKPCRSTSRLRHRLCWMHGGRMPCWMRVTVTRHIFCRAHGLMQLTSCSHLHHSCSKRCASDISLSLCCASVLLHHCTFLIWTAGHADMHFALIILSGGTRAICAPHSTVSRSLLCFAAPVVLNICLNSAHLSCFCLVFMELSNFATSQPERNMRPSCDLHRWHPS